MFIPNMWYGVLEGSEVKPGKPVAFRRLGEDLVFWRDGQGKVAVMRDVCPHRQCKLSPGKIVDGNLQCHFHGFQYNQSGAVHLIPANGRNGAKPKIFQCTTFVAQEAHGFIWLWNGEPQAEYPPLPFFQGLEAYNYTTRQTQWDVDYTQAVCSLLDVSHLPFVHANTIGRGGGTLVNGPYTTMADNQLRVWLNNQPDAGLPAMLPSQVPPPNSQPDLWLNFPNVWQLHLSERVRVLQVLAPVDNEHVVLYMRSYAKLTGVPAIDKTFCFVSNIYNRYVAQEDEVIVKTQPKRADLEIGDRFIPADRPIALYLKHRRNLILNQPDASTPAISQTVMDGDESYEGQTREANSTSPSLVTMAS